MNERIYRYNEKGLRAGGWGGVSGEWLCIVIARRSLGSIGRVLNGAAKALVSVGPWTALDASIGKDAPRLTNSLVDEFF